MEFEKLWEIYPNKKGKAKALTKYILSRKKGTTYEQVYDGINNYIEYIKKNKISSQYIKHGDTYFNNQCWLDEYKDTKVSKNNNDEQWDLLKGVYDGTIAFASLDAVDILSLSRISWQSKSKCFNDDFKKNNKERRIYAIYTDNFKHIQKRSLFVFC